MRALQTVCAAAVTAVCVCVPPAAAQDVAPNAKRADIERLLEMTRALALGEQMASAMTTQMANVVRSANPAIPPRVIDALSEVVDAVIAERLPEFQEQVIVLYDRHFEHEDIRGLMTFYDSPLGRKTIQLLPLITQESMELGRAWGASLGPEIEQRVMERLRREGFGL
jgi:uncharacterized protein